MKSSVSINASRGTNRLQAIQLLSAIPTIDCILNQLNNAFHLSLGPVSSLQIFRGCLLLIFLLLSGLALLRSPGTVWKIPVPAVAGALLVAAILSHELAVTGGIAMAGVTAYGQLLYWLLFWTTAALLCGSRRDAYVLLRGLSVGAVLTALSVYLGFLFGGINYYELDAVRSSAGWFETAKMITGVLITGGVVLLYLGRRRQDWLYPALAMFCFVASLLTYARAGMVALIAVLLWLVIWFVLLGRSSTRPWLSRFLVLLASACVLAALFIPTDRIFARWGDVSDSDKAGSGRATFWKVAVDAYVGGSTEQQVFGRGYAAMSELLFRNYGDDIKHTHNDGLDMLLVAGAGGALWLLTFIGSVSRRVALTSVFSSEGAAGVAILLAYLCHSQLTGQMWGTDAMSYYTLSLCALGVAHRHAETPRIDALPIGITPQRAQ